VDLARQKLAKSVQSIAIETYNLQASLLLQPPGRLAQHHIAREILQSPEARLRFLHCSGIGQTRKEALSRLSVCMSLIAVV
jgi:hypothetical protein